MRFKVPQYIEVESKLFGPLTFKQFVYLAGAGSISLGLWFGVPKIVAVVIAVPIIILGVLLAFYHINSKPFIAVMQDYFKYTLTTKLYIWKKQPKEVQAKTVIVKHDLGIDIPVLTTNKLKDKTWSLDVANTEAKDAEVR